MENGSIVSEAAMQTPPAGIPAPPANIPAPPVNISAPPMNNFFQTQPEVTDKNSDLIKKYVLIGIAAILGIVIIGIAAHICIPKVIALFKKKQTTSFNPVNTSSFVFPELPSDADTETKRKPAAPPATGKTTKPGAKKSTKYKNVKPVSAAKPAAAPQSLSASKASYAEAEKAGLVFSKDRKVLLKSTDKQLCIANIPEGVTTIDSRVFAYHNSLMAVRFPKTLVEIREAAFLNCPLLHDFTLPAGLKVLGPNVFNACTKIKKIVLPPGIKEIPRSLFANCFNLKEVVIPEGITAIGINAFRGCNALEEIRLPESMQVISEFAFFSCLNLKKINIPSGMKRIENGAFRYCKRLKDINIPASVKVSPYAFKGKY